MKLVAGEFDVCLPKTVHSSAYFHIRLVNLGGLVTEFLPLDPRFAGSSSAKDDEFPSQRVKPSVPCRKILRHVKEPYEYEKDTS
jgi:hypothetical protein